jgi:hypothetical protein
MVNGNREQRLIEETVDDKRTEGRERTVETTVNGSGGRQ